MHLQIGRADHHRLRSSGLIGRPIHHVGEDALVVPQALPAVVEGLRRPIFLGRSAPSQAIAIDDDYTAQNAPADGVPWSGVAGADRHRDVRRGPA